MIDLLGSVEFGRWLRPVLARMCRGAQFVKILVY
jgi:hypothetical protein